MKKEGEEKKRKRKIEDDRGVYNEVVCMGGRKLK